MNTMRPLVSRHGLMILVSVSSLPAFAQTGTVETIDVQGDPLQQAMLREKELTPGAVSLLDVDDLFERGVVNMADALRYIPGVWSMSSSGSDSVFMSSRGSNLDATNYDMNGIKLFQDGLPVTTADGNNHNRIIDPLAARFASIARGANALKFGASTLGGAMNYTSPTGHDAFANQLFLNTGSFDMQALRTSAGFEFSDSLDAYISVEAKRREGYREHNDSERSGIYSNLGWRVRDDVESRFYFSYINNDEELPGALTATQIAANPRQSPPDALTGHYQVDVLTKRIANKTTFTLAGGSTLEFGASREDQDLFHPIVDVRVDFDGPGPMGPTQVFSLLIDTKQENTGAMVRYDRQVGNHNLLMGMNWGRTSVTGGNYTHDGAQPSGMSTGVDNTAESLEAFIMDRWAINNSLTFVYGLQALTTERDVRNLDIASNTLRNPKADFDSINPRAGLTWSLNAQVSLFGNLSRLYEAPTNYELEDDVRANNATLDAMHGTVLEVGTRGSQALGRNHSWNWDISLYYAALEDEILSQDDPSAPGTSLTTNVDNTIHTGIEALISGSFQVGNGARIEPLLSVTVNDFSFSGDPVYGDRSLPAAPGYAFRGEVLYHMANGYYAGPTFDVVDERYADFMNSYKVDSYALVGLRAGLNRDSWRLFIEARNLTDKHYISNFSVVNQYANSSKIFSSGEPRSVYAGVQMSF